MQAPGHIQQFTPMSEPIHARKKQSHCRKFLPVMRFPIQPRSSLEFLALQRAKFQQGGFSLAVHRICRKLMREFRRRN